MTVRILTKDPLLMDALRLLLPEEEFTVVDGAADLTVLDGDTLTPTATGGPLLVICRRDIPVPRGSMLLHSPFDLSSFADLCRRTAAPLALSPLEARLLALLKEADGKPVSRERLMQELWGEGATEEKLNLYIHYLRKKIETDGKKRIFSCRGKGYYYQC